MLALYLKGYKILETVLVRLAIAAILVLGIVYVYKLDTHQKVLPRTTPTNTVSITPSALNRLLHASTGTPIVLRPEFSNTGLSASDKALLVTTLSALKPPTKTVYTANSHFAATPPPIPSSYSPTLKAIEGADEIAVKRVLATTPLDTHLTVRQVPIAPSRVSALYTPKYAGVGYALVRKGNIELVPGALFGVTHVRPAVSLDYMIPRTSLAGGVTYIGGKGVQVGIVVGF